MSFLDEQKRARRGGKALLKLIVDKKNFDANLEAYTAADGIIDAGFLETLEQARVALKAIDNADFVNRLSGFSAPFQEAFLEYLVANGRHEILAQIRDHSENKELVKSVKQHLHALKTKGITVQESKQKGWKRTVETEKAETPCLTSNYDFRGHRVLFISQEQAGSIRALHVVENDKSGIAHYQTALVTRSKLKDMLKELQSIGRERLKEIPFETAFWFLMRAFDRHKKSSTEPPSGFITTLSFLKKPEPLADRHPFFATVLPADLEYQDKLIENSHALFDDPYAREWTIGPSAMQTFQYKISQIAKTPEHLTDAHVAAQVDALVTEAVDRYFDSAVRGGYHDRLMDMAWHCADKGEKNLGLTAFVTAKAVVDVGRPAHEIPFCRDLLARLLPRSGEKSAEPSIIAP